VLHHIVAILALREFHADAHQSLKNVLFLLFELCNLFHQTFMILLTEFGSQFFLVGSYLRLQLFQILLNNPASIGM